MKTKIFQSVRDADLFTLKPFCSNFFIYSTGNEYVIGLQSSTALYKAFCKVFLLQSNNLEITN